MHNVLNLGDRASIALIPVSANGIRIRHSGQVAARCLPCCNPCFHFPIPKRNFFHP